ncbi:MAG TPA: hypothetical protein V6C65_31535, partial [Allocoleopsis sp.]
GIVNDVKSAYLHPDYHITRMMTSQAADGVDLPIHTAEFLSDTLSVMQAAGTESLTNGLKRAFNHVVQLSEPQQGESTVQGRVAVSSTATALTGVGAGFTGGNAPQTPSSLGNSGGSGSK